MASPQERLSILLNKLALPRDLVYGPDQHVHHPSTVTTAHDLNRPIYVQQDDDLLDRSLQPILSEFADHLFSHATQDDIVSIESDLDITTQKAMPWAHRHLSGEDGLRKRLTAWLIEIINHIITTSYISRSFPLHVEHLPDSIADIYWRAVGSGSSPKTDFELIVLFDDGNEWVVCSFEIKTTLAMTASVVNTMTRKLKQGLVITNDSPYLGPVRNYIREADTDESRVILQTTTQYMKHPQPSCLALLSNYNEFFLWSGDNTRISTSDRVGPADHTSARELYLSPLGLVLGATLLALDKSGLGSVFRPPAQEGLEVQDDTDGDAPVDTGVQGNARFSSDTIRARGVVHLESQPQAGPSSGPAGRGASTLEVDLSDTESQRSPNPDDSMSSHPRLNDDLPDTRPEVEKQTKMQSISHHVSEAEVFVTSESLGRLVTQYSTTDPAIWNHFGLQEPFFGKLDTKIFRNLPRLRISSALARLGVEHLRPYYQQTVVLDSIAGQGNVWTTFRAFSGQDRLIVKLCKLDPFHHHRTAHIRRELHQECRVMDGPLVALQGKTVPRLLGFAGSLQPADGSRRGFQEVWSATVEDIGLPLHPFVRQLPRVRNAIKQIYGDLHAAGVLHGDVEWRHVLSAGSQTDLRLIDFGRSRLRDDMTEVEWEAERTGELRCLEAMLSGART